MRTMHLIKVSEIKAGDTIAEYMLLNGCFNPRSLPFDGDQEDLGKYMASRPKTAVPNKILEILDRNEPEIHFRTDQFGCLSLGRDLEVILLHRPWPKDRWTAWYEVTKVIRKHYEFLEAACQLRGEEFEKASSHAGQRLIEIQKAVNTYILGIPELDKQPIPELPPSANTPGSVRTPMKG